MSGCIAKSVWMDSDVIEFPLRGNRVFSKEYAFFLLFGETRLEKSAIKNNIIK